MAPMADRIHRSETSRLIEQAVRGDRRALGELLGRHRERLHRMVALRLDRRLQGRVDPSYILQEAAKIPNEGKLRLAEALERLVQLYDAWGNPDQATRSRRELEKADAKPPDQ